MSSFYRAFKSECQPKEWALDRLENVCDLITCGVAARPEYVEQGGIPFLSSQNVKNGRVIWSGFNSISVESHLELVRNNKPKVGDILYTRVGSFGEAAVVDRDVEFSVFVSLTLIKPKRSLVDNYFLKFLLNSAEVKALANNTTTGLGVQNLNVSEVRDFELPFPPLDEQQKIATILTAVDEVIASTTAQINKLKDLKTGMMQELLSKGIGQDGKPHTEFKDSPVGRIPKVWSIKKLQDIAVVQSGVAKNGSLQGELIDIPYLRVANVQDGYLDLSEIKCISIESSRVERFLLKKDDVLVNEGGDFDKLGRGHIWDAQINPCLHQNHVFVVRANREFMLPLFFNYFSGSEIGKRYYLGCAKQTTNLASINSTQLKLMPIVVPPLVEQEQICTTLKAIDDKIFALTNVINRKKNLKKALMHDLLTGKVRV